MLRVIIEILLIIPIFFLGTIGVHLEDAILKITGRSIKIVSDDPIIRTFHRITFFMALIVALVLLFTSNSDLLNEFLYQPTLSLIYRGAAMIGFSLGTHCGYSDEPFNCVLNRP